MTSRPDLRGTHGAVASTHWLGTAAGMTMFDRGGNAFDAAAAAAFVIQVVEPHMNGPAGDAPILVHDGSSSRTTVICGQGPMPKKASVAAAQDLGLSDMPGSGLLSATVPGAFSAWIQLVRRHGRLRLKDVLAPAIGHAERGFPLLGPAAEMIRVLQPLFVNEWIESGKTFLNRGTPPKEGELFRNPALAATFRRIVDEATAPGRTRDQELAAAEKVFYDGFVADAIAEFVVLPSIDSTGARHVGWLSGDDLSSWRAGEEGTLSATYKGLEVHKAGPWSQGPVFLQQLGILEGIGLDAMTFGSFEHLHHVVESAKLAFADREAWYGDPLFSDVPVAALLDPDYARARRDLIDGTASGELRPGSPDGRRPFVPQPGGGNLGATSAAPPWLQELGRGIPNVLRYTAGSSDTTTVTAVDHEGNMVAAAPSGGWLKSSPVIPGLGFPLGTRGQMATLAEGHNNTLGPGKRPRTTLSPTIVLNDAGAPHMAFGTPGGDQQDQWTLNFFLNRVEFGMSPQQAIEATTFHTEHFPTSFTPKRAKPRSIVVEAGFSDDTIAALRGAGHDVATVPAQTLSKVCSSGTDPRGGVFAAASPRGQQAYGAAT